MAKKKSKIGLMFFGISVIFVLVITYLATQSKKGEHSERFVIGATQEPDSLHPLLASMMAQEVIEGLMFEPMVEYDNQWDLHPRLVESIPSLENGGVKNLPDGKVVVTWKFKEGLKWSDGHPLTPDDFIFSWQAELNPKFPVVTRDTVSRIEKMEALDDRTLVVTWKAPYAYFDQGHNFIPKHVLGPIYEKEKDLPEMKEFSEGDYNLFPMGNGPYMMTSKEDWKKGSYITLTRNPHFYGDPGFFKQITYKKTAALESDFVSGNIDAIDPDIGLTLPQALDFEKRAGTKYRFHYTTGLIWEHIDFNLDNPMLKDKRVRQALVYGIDREGMVSKLFSDKEVVSHSSLPEKHYGYNPDVRKYPYNPQKASQLLDEAGWKLKDDGYRYKDGEKFSLVIMSTTDNQARADVEQLIQADWKKIGVELSVKNEPARVFFGETTNKRKFPHLAMYAWMLSPVSDNETSCTIKNIPSKENNWQGQNYTGWRNARADEIYRTIPTILDEKKRRELLQEGEEIWSEELPAIPLFLRTQVSVTHENLQNWKPTGMQVPITWNAQDWKAL
ncbi:MAG: peptide ABC transporter substrate-binding protein [Deltaproteobacteria bacterium]|nr:peptide ABC transporter substrate-binding protein [Deltaproteobacteria bacterium]